jgi:hypothetical protein
MANFTYRVQWLVAMAIQVAKVLNEWRATLGKGSASSAPARKATGGRRASKRGSALALSILSSITGSFSSKNSGMLLMYTRPWRTSPN